MIWISFSQIKEMYLLHSFVFKIFSSILPFSFVNRGSFAHTLFAIYHFRITSHAQTLFYFTFAFLYFSCFAENLRSTAVRLDEVHRRYTKE